MLSTQVVDNAVGVLGEVSEALQNLQDKVPDLIHFAQNNLKATDDALKSLNLAPL